MRGIGSPALFELRAQKMAECRGLAPLARRHAFVSTEARLACPVGIPKWPAEPKLDRAKVGPRGRTCTCNLPGLSGTPLHWATRGWLAKPKRWRRLVPTVGFAPTLC